MVKCNSEADGGSVETAKINSLAPLRAILDASKLGSKCWLETAFGQPYSAAGFGNRFKDGCKAAELPQCTCRGLRKIGAVRAAEAGAGEHELVAMFGWENADMARIYTRKTAQKKLAANGAVKLAHTGTIVPLAVPPKEKASKNIDVRDEWCPVGE